MFRPCGTAALLTLLALTGCSGGDGDNGASEQSTLNVVVPNPYQERMLKLDAVGRKLALRRAVQDDGGTCRSIRDSHYQQDYKGMAMWVAYCSNADWAVYLAPSGIVQVRACKESAELGLPACTARPAGKALEPLWSQDSNPLPPPVNQM